jgi:hypothetical protein
VGEPLKRNVMFLPPMNRKHVAISLPLILVLCLVILLSFSNLGLGILLTIVFWLFSWLVLYLLPGVMLSLPFWILGRNRANWVWWEFAILLVPYLVWVACMVINDRCKSIPNFKEMFWLGCALVLASCLRVTLGTRINRTLIASLLIFAYCLAAVVVWAVVAPVPLSKN